VTEILVTGDPNIRFYFGSPLMVEQGLALGTLCGIDQKPRSLLPAQRKALGALTRQVVLLLNIRRCVLALGDVIQDAQLTNSTEMLAKIQNVNLELRRMLFSLDVHLGSLDPRPGRVRNLS
jgi:DNA-binding transcriptional regulator/RsmH inhibitor MraZ